LNSDHDFAALSGELDGVLNQIDQNLLHAQFVDPNTNLA
jgi:hypothetical protein